MKPDPVTGVDEKALDVSGWCCVLGNAIVDSRHPDQYFSKQEETQLSMACCRQSTQTCPDQTHKDQVEIHIRNLLKNKVSVCIEVLVLPDCLHGEEQARLVLIPTNKIHNTDWMLLEQWTLEFQAVKKSRSNGTPTHSVLQAVRSYLHFSQLSAWLHASGAKEPKHIAYRISPSGDFCTHSFRLPPDIHTFPECSIHSVMVSVSVCALPRLQTVVEARCSVCHTDPPAAQPIARSVTPSNTLEKPRGVGPHDYPVKVYKESSSSESDSGRQTPVALSSSNFQKLSGRDSSQSPNGREYAETAKRTRCVSLNCGKVDEFSSFRDLSEDVGDHAVFYLPSSKPSSHRGQEPATPVAACDSVFQSRRSFNRPGEASVQGVKQAFKAPVYTTPTASSHCSDIKYPVGREFKKSGSSSKSLLKMVTQKDLTALESVEQSSETLPKAVAQAKFNSSPRSMFNTSTGLPLQSSPAPLKKINSCSFEYDNSLNNSKAIKNSVSCLSLSGLREDKEVVRRHSQLYSASAPASTNSLLGNFEESILNGRLEPCGMLDGFRVEIGASGSFCPPHVTLPVMTFFFQLSDDNAPSPYLGHIDLDSLGRRGYRVPNKGTIQVTLFNPNKTVVKMFVVLYDFSNMPNHCQTILRQRTVYMPVPGSPSDLPDNPVILRHLIHLRFASSRSGKMYLHSDIRIIFSQDHTEYDSKVASYEHRSFTEVPSNPMYSPIR